MEPRTQNIFDEVEFLDTKDADYRYQRAISLMKKDVWACPDDEWVDKYLDFISYMNDDVIKNKIDQVMPDIFRAVRIYSCVSDTLIHLILECGILANVQPKTIANKLGLEEKTVEAYEALFFDVREHLDNPIYVLTKVAPSAIPLFKRSVQDRGFSKVSVNHEDIYKIVAWKEGWKKFVRIMSLQGSIKELDSLKNMVSLTDSIKRAFAGLFEDIHQLNVGWILKRSSDVEIAKGDVEGEEHSLTGALREFQESLQVEKNRVNFDQQDYEAKLPNREYALLEEDTKFSGEGNANPESE